MVTQITGNVAHLFGLAEDVKPTINIPIGSDLTIVDGIGNIIDIYVWDGTTWNH
jgi:hypothetical protein